MLQRIPGRCIISNNQQQDHPHLLVITSLSLLAPATLGSPGQDQPALIAFTRINVPIHNHIIAII